MITEKQIEEKALLETKRMVTRYAPDSYRRGFIDGAMWILNTINR